MRAAWRETTLTWAPSAVSVTPGGEKLLAQRNVVVQRPAPTADAPGGAQALAEATRAAVDEISQWLQQQP